MNAERRETDVLLARLPPADGSGTPLALAVLTGAV
jgi:hypothetical protein